MNAAQFEQMLADRFNPAAAAAFSGTIRIDATRVTTVFRVTDATLEVNAQLIPDATFYFADPLQAAAILRGEQDPIAAFMSGAFRADSHLTWVFPLLAFFR